LDLVLRPEVILSSDSKSLCRGAIEEFLDTGLPCSFVDPIKTKRCVNTKRGHVKGHQDRHGALLWNGPFDVQLEVTTILHDLQVISNGGERVKFLTRRHLLSLASAPVSDFWGTISNAKPRGPSGSSTINALTKAIDRLLGISESNHSNTCFGCVFKNPEYEFPCGHYLCSRCIQDFDQSNHFGQYPGTVTFHFCVLCGANRDNEGWPFRVSISPKISGLRLLSLDGGGVRGVVEIITLKRIEDGIGLSLPIGEFFDFVAGTSAGGMIALGVGFHGWDAETCMAKYDAMIRGGLSKKFGTTAPGPIGSIVRWLRGSLYETRPLEKALQQAYPQEKMYGLRRVGGSKLHNLPRVAVTTTVNGGEARLFANYSCGDNKSFLNSSALTWEVARSTSAAPIYFEAYHVPTAGVDCRDGGLRDNNPIQIAVDESRRIWGPHTTFDAILSIGSGSALNPPRRPKTHGKLPERFATLVETFFRTMDGQEAWERYKKGVYGTLDFRSYRFNVKFKGANQPPLDAVSEIDNMVAETTNYFFHMNNNPSDPLAIMPPVQDAIQEVALRLRASLFFFEPDNIVYNKDRTIAMVRGHICSRLTRNSEALRKLIALTEGFMIQETFFNVPIPAEHMLLKVPVRVQQVINATSTQFRIDVKFKEGGYIVPISGCPISLEVST
ncbi:FabD/lysophospholipase-like protein, partial [Amniculicola lignicola CBS 123094]